MKVEMIVRVTAESRNETRIPRYPSYGSVPAISDGPREHPLAANGSLQYNFEAGELSSWSGSAAKRLFDCACVCAALPLAIPTLVIVAIAVWLTSTGPIFFRQRRVGNRGRTFTIFKFRTMIHDANAAYQAVTTDGNQPFTAIGPFLRRSKLDELPQILNVLRGDMSLVGPRPKMPEHAIGGVSCRPGITGAATLAFAREETLLDPIPAHELESFYHRVVLPAKLHLDSEYMSRATFFSDLKLIVNSILRRWDESAVQSLTVEQFKSSHELVGSTAADMDPDWIGGVPIHVASISARVGYRRWLDGAS